MASPTNSPQTPADRIQELSNVNAQIPALLKAASTAISALTNASSGDLDSHKATFQASTRTFFSLTTQVSASLLDQVDAMEAAHIIPSTQAKAAPRSTQVEQDVESEVGVTNGGLGSLDIGWLNSRAGEGKKRGGVEEAALLERVRACLERVVGEEAEKDEKMDEA